MGRNRGRDWIGEATSKLREEAEEVKGSSTPEDNTINLVHEARALLEQWSIEMEEKRLQASFYEGAIYGLNKYLEKLGSGRET